MSFLPASATMNFVRISTTPVKPHLKRDSLVLSSLLFAKGSELLLPAVQQLYEAGVSGLAYKTVIFHELPEDVLAFCNATRSAFQFWQRCLFLKKYYL